MAAAATSSSMTWARVPATREAAWFHLASLRPDPDEAQAASGGPSYHLNVRHIPIHASAIPLSGAFVRMKYGKAVLSDSAGLVHA